MGLITFFAGKASLANIAMDLGEFELKALRGPKDGSEVIYNLFLNIVLALKNNISVDRVSDEIHKGIARFRIEKNINLVVTSWCFISTHWVKGEEEAKIAGQELERAFFEAYGVSINKFPIPPKVLKVFNLFSKSK